MSKYKFKFDLSVSIQDVLDADDGIINIATNVCDEENIEGDLNNIELEPSEEKNEKT